MDLLAMLRGNPAKPTTLDTQMANANPELAKTAATTNNPAANPGNNNNSPTGTNGNPAVNVNQNNPENVTQNNSSNTPASPLDAFTKVWEDKKPDPNKPAGPEPLFNYNKENFEKSVGSMNFTGKLSPEKVQKALGGDAQSFMEVLNEVSRESFSQALTSSHNLIEQGHLRALPRLKNEMDTSFKTNATRDALLSANAAFSHPAVKPMLDNLQKQFQQTYPEATPQEIKQHAMNYLKTVGKIFAGDESAGGEEEIEGTTNPSALKPRDPEDFSNFFG